MSEQTKPKHPALSKKIKVGTIVLMTFARDNRPMPKETFYSRMIVIGDTELNELFDHIVKYESEGVILTDIRYVAPPETEKEPNPITGCEMHGITKE